MEEGTTLSKLRVGGSLVSFQWLACQKKLKAGLTPSCVKVGKVFSDVTETAKSEENVPHFSEHGVLPAWAVLCGWGAGYWGVSV